MNVDGTYRITIHTPMGDTQSTWTLKADGESLSGVSEDAMTGHVEFTGGTVNGGVFAFTLDLPMRLEIEGRVEGDRVSGTASAMFGPSLFEGSRI
jgi:hypothetical protein